MTFLHKLTQRSCHYAIFLDELAEESSNAEKSAYTSIVLLAEFRLPLLSDIWNRKDFGKTIEIFLVSKDAWIYQVQHCFLS